MLRHMRSSPTARTRAATAAALALLLAALSLPSGSPARGGDDNRREVRRAGDCTGHSRAELKLGEENGRIEVELEVDQNRAGVRWQVTLRHNGRVVSRRSATTRGSSGSFTVRKLVANRAGRDSIRASARRSGESCSAAASF